jgi:NAD(P)-dependent dehydrogenase (short-subunit alcohol dehydrogenase family)
MDKFDPVGDMDRQIWDRVIAVNLTAPAMVTKRAVNAFAKHKTKGAIVNIASVAGIRGFTSGMSSCVASSERAFDIRDSQALHTLRASMVCWA